MSGLVLTYDFSQITGRLWCGSQIRNSSDVNECIRAGITHIIDCCEAPDALELKGSGIALLSNPTLDDGQHKTSDWFGRGIDFAFGALGHPGYNVLCHCSGGVARSSSMCYAIMRAQGWDGDAAVSLLQRRRPQVTVRYQIDADIALRQLRWVE
jgi:hypothetical protein